VIGPVIVRADDANHQERRYYDRSGKDYHTCKDNEDRAYRAYVQEQHRDYRDFNKVKRAPAAAILHLAPSTLR
jgi:heat shock protein HspQ